MNYASFIWKNQRTLSGSQSYSTGHTLTTTTREPLMIKAPSELSYDNIEIP
jgi:hypothetical protein